MKSNFPRLIEAIRQGMAIGHHIGAVVNVRLRGEVVADFAMGAAEGIKNTLFGGEGLFFATLTGPGRVWLQSMPFSRLVGRIASTLPSKSGGGAGEGSVLGALGGMLGGD